jgi:hypothetical protein
MGTLYLKGEAVVIPASHQLLVEFTRSPFPLQDLRSTNNNRVRLSLATSQSGHKSVWSSCCTWSLHLALYCYYLIWNCIWQLQKHDRLVQYATSRPFALPLPRSLSVEGQSSSSSFLAPFLALFGSICCFVAIYLPVK